VLEGIGLDLNFKVVQIQIFDCFEVSCEEIVVESCYSAAVLNDQAIEFWEVIYNLLREKVNVGWTVEPNSRSD
jgi:ASC-1-like (ASCH) protein